MKISHRVGTSPADRGSTNGATCPDLLRLDNGDYLIIGKTPRVPRITTRELAEHGAGIGDDEQAVIVPAEVVHAAAADILQHHHGSHVYLSTGCLHDDHDYCKSMTGLNGAKRPGSCKHCATPCICACHTAPDPAAVAS